MNRRTSAAGAPAAGPHQLNAAVATALILGFGWALLGFAHQATPLEYLALGFGASLSLLLGQWAVMSVKPHAVMRVVLALALASAAVWVLGYWLKLHTHHRPLAAATLALFALGALALSAAAVTRLPFDNLAGKIASAAVVLGLLVACSWSLLTSGRYTVVALLEGAAGVALLLASEKLRARAQLQEITRPLALTLAALLVAGCVFGVLSGAGAEASQKAPVLAGLIGLLR